MFEAFTRHPASVNETYFEHLCTAMSFALTLLVATLVCFVHSVLPFLFVKTGSALITRLHDKMVANRVRNTASTTEIDAGMQPMEFMI